MATTIGLKFVHSWQPGLYSAPTRAKAGDAGFDIVSSETITIGAGNVGVVATPFILADTPELLPDGSDYYIKVNGRSGLAAKHGVFPITGTIDKDYRGQIKIVLLNAGAMDFEIQSGDRIAQLVVHKIEAANLRFELVDRVVPTERGSTGFGSTGGLGK